MSGNNVATFFKMYLFAYKIGTIKNMKGTKEFCNINMFLSVSIYFTHIGLFVLELSCRYKIAMVESVHVMLCTTLHFIEFCFREASFQRAGRF